MGTDCNLFLLDRNINQIQSSAAFSPDGKLLASGSGDKTITLWDISDLMGQ